MQNLRWPLIYPKQEALKMKGFVRGRDFTIEFACRTDALVCMQNSGRPDHKRGRNYQDMYLLFKPV